MKRRKKGLKTIAILTAMVFIISVMAGFTSSDGFGYVYYDSKMIVHNDVYYNNVIGSHPKHGIEQAYFVTADHPKGRPSEPPRNTGPHADGDGKRVQGQGKSRYGRLPIQSLSQSILSAFLKKQKNGASEERACPTPRILPRMQLPALIPSGVCFHR